MTMPPEPPQGQYGQGQQGSYAGQGQYGQSQPGQYPGRPLSGGQPGWTSGAQPPWLRPPAPPLEPRQRRGAFIAGAAALNLVNLGGTLLLAALILGAILAFFSAVLTTAARNGNDIRVDPQARAFFEFLDSINAPAWLIGGGLLGFVILVLGIFTSFWILRAHEVVRPWAVTWSSVGISIPALVIVSSVLSVLGQVVGTLSLSSLFPAPGTAVPDATAVGFGTGIALVVVSFVVSLIVVAVVGALIWWWMAHVLRRPLRPATAPSTEPAPR
jgi:hypothetical protein